MSVPYAPERMNRRRPRLLAAVIAVVALASLALVAVVVGANVLAPPGVTLPPGPTPLAVRTEPLLPDLAMPPMADFNVGTNADGEVGLRFSATIANIGPGRFWIRGSRDGPNAERWQLTQRVAEAAGGFTEQAVGGDAVFGGHGHEHWHLRSGASYLLTPVGGGDARSRTKAGFCFFDQVRYRASIAGSPDQAVFPNATCGEQDSVEIEMGMSSGWSDPYHWNLEDQEVDVTGLPVGRYRLEAIADPDGWYEELDKSNNGTWAIVELYDSDGLMAARLIESAPEP